MKKYNIKSKTLIAFLKSKGWNIEKITAYDYVMKPPYYLQVKFEEPNVKFYIPLSDYEKAIDYSFVMDKLMNSFSILHDMDKSILEELCSKDMEEIKANIEFEKEILAFG